MSFIVAQYEDLSDHLNVVQSKKTSGVIIQLLDIEDAEVEADEMWSFVGKKENKQWVWVAMDADTRQIIAFYIGDRSKLSAKELWKLIPETYRKNATFYTDN